nr:hypothetical protein CFP56_22075 [Quercus suber]
MPPKKKRVANSNSEEPIVNLRRPTKARVDIEAEVTQDMRNNERLRVTRTDPLDEATARLLDRLAHVASRGTGVDNYAESVKRAMRLEEDFKNNVRKENPPKNTGQTGFRQGTTQGHWNKKGSFGSSGSNSSSNKPENKNPPQNAQGRSSNAFLTCGRFHGDKLCLFEGKACYNCGKTGHLARSCTSPQQNSMAQPRKND